MPFALSGITITQTDEAAKTITAVVAIANGIRVTCADHGFAVGQIITHTGTTGYNGQWVISAVPSSGTYDIVSQSYDGAGVSPLIFSVTSTGSVARGDASPAGLSAISGVTTWQLVGGAKPITYYSIPNNVRLVISGLLRIPRGHVIIMQGDYGSSGRVHLSGGRLWIDKRLSRFGGVSYQGEDAIVFTGATGTGGRSWENPPQAFLHLETGEFTQWCSPGPSSASRTLIPEHAVIGRKPTPTASTTNPSPIPRPPTGPGSQPSTS